MQTDINEQSRYEVSNLIPFMLASGHPQVHFTARVGILSSYYGVVKNYVRRTLETMYPVLSKPSTP